MTRKEAISKLRQDDASSEEMQIAIRSLEAWNTVIEDIEARVKFAREVHANDYAIGMDAALFLIRKHLNESDIIE